MITVRISFKKKNEASYISLLDMQRVMQRVLKRSGLPVWHTLGFNPHIYMTFACPLSLGQESECECVDVKTEAEAPDFAQWKEALNAIMPAGIEVYNVEPVQMKADLIAYACYEISYPADAAPVLAQYNALESVPVEKKEQAQDKDRGVERIRPGTGAVRSRRVGAFPHLPAGFSGPDAQPLAAGGVPGRKNSACPRQTPTSCARNS